MRCEKDDVYDIVYKIFVKKIHCSDLITYTFFPDYPQQVWVLFPFSSKGNFVFTYLFDLFCFSVLGMEPRALGILAKHSGTEQHIPLTPERDLRLKMKVLPSTQFWKKLFTCLMDQKSRFTWFILGSMKGWLWYAWSWINFSFRCSFIAATSSPSSIC